MGETERMDKGRAERSNTGMGWDSIVYKDRHQSFNDMELTAVRHFLLAELESQDICDEDRAALKNYISGWNWLCPGVVTGTEPDSYLQDLEKRKEKLLELLKLTGKRISAFGPEVPLDYLERAINTDEQFTRQGARYLGAQPVERFLGILEKYKKLIEG
jgi:hypothetical protein